MQTFSRFDPDDLEEWAALWHPNARVTPPDGWPEPGPFVGREAIVRELKRMTEWAEYGYEDVEVVAESAEWIVITWHWHARGHASGVEADFDFANASRIRDGQIIESHFRRDRNEALEAAGLERR